jgi:hypothetical protein
MTQNKYIRFALTLSNEQFIQVYQGIAKNVQVIADDGKMIAFPAGRIKPFLTREGISGYFEMELTVDNKFVSIKKFEPE